MVPVMQQFTQKLFPNATIYTKILNMTTLITCVLISFLSFLPLSVLFCNAFFNNLHKNSIIYTKTLLE